MANNPNYLNSGNKNDYLGGKSSLNKSPFGSKTAISVDFNYQLPYQKLNYGLAQGINPTQNVPKKSNPKENVIVQAMNDLLAVASLPITAVESSIGEIGKAVNGHGFSVGDIGKHLASQFTSHPYMGTNMIEDISGNKNLFNHVSGVGKFFINLGVDTVAGLGVGALENMGTSVMRESLGGIAKAYMGEAFNDAMKQTGNIDKASKLFGAAIGNPLRFGKDAVKWSWQTWVKYAKRSIIENGKDGNIYKAILKTDDMIQNTKRSIGEKFISGYSRSAKAQKLINENRQIYQDISKNTTFYKKEFDYNLKNLDLTAKDIHSNLKDIYSEVAHNKQRFKELFGNINENNTNLKDLKNKMNTYLKANSGSLKKDFFNENETAVIKNGLKSHILDSYYKDVKHGLLSSLYGFTAKIFKRDNKFVNTFHTISPDKLKFNKKLITDVTKKEQATALEKQSPILKLLCDIFGEKNPQTFLSRETKNKFNFHPSVSPAQQKYLKEFIKVVKKDFSPKISSSSVLRKIPVKYRGQIYRKIANSNAPIKDIMRKYKKQYFNKATAEQLHKTKILDNIEKIPQFEKDMKEFETYQEQLRNQKEGVNNLNKSIINKQKTLEQIKTEKEDLIKYKEQTSPKQRKLNNEKNNYEQSLNKTFKTYKMGSKEYTKDNLNLLHRKINDKLTLLKSKELTPSLEKKITKAQQDLENINHYQSKFGTKEEQLKAQKISGKKEATFGERHKFKINSKSGTHTITENKINKKIEVHNKKEAQLESEIKEHQENINKIKNPEEVKNPYNEMGINYIGKNTFKTWSKALPKLEENINHLAAMDYIHGDLKGKMFREENTTANDLLSHKIETSVPLKKLVGVHNNILDSGVEGIQKISGLSRNKIILKHLIHTAKTDKETLFQDSLKNTQKEEVENMVKTSENSNNLRRYNIQSTGKASALSSAENGGGFVFTNTIENVLKQLGYSMKNMEQMTMINGLFKSGDIRTLGEAIGKKDLERTLKVKAVDRYKEKDLRKIVQKANFGKDVNGRQFRVENILDEKSHVRQMIDRVIKKSQKGEFGEAATKVKSEAEKNIKQFIKEAKQRRKNGDIEDGYVALSPGTYDTFRFLNESANALPNWKNVFGKSIQVLSNLWRTIKLFTGHFMVNVGLSNFVNAHNFGILDYSTQHIRSYKKIMLHNKLIKRFREAKNIDFTKMSNNSNPTSYIDELAKLTKNNKELELINEFKKDCKNGLFVGDYGRFDTSGQQNSLFNGLSKKINDAVKEETINGKITKKGLDLLAKGKRFINFNKHMVGTEDSAARMSFFHSIDKNGISYNLKHFVQDELDEVGHSGYRGKKDWKNISQDNKDFLNKKLTEKLQIQYGANHSTRFENTTLKKWLPFYSYQKGSVMRVVSQVMHNSSYARRVFDLNNMFDNFNTNELSKMPGYNFMASYIPIFMGNNTRLLKFNAPSFEAVNVFNPEVAGKLNPFFKAGYSFATGRSVETGENVPWYNSISDFLPVNQAKHVLESSKYVLSGGKKGQLFPSIYKTYDMNKLMTENYYKYSQYIIKNMSSGQRYLYFRYLYHLRESFESMRSKGWVHKISSTNPYY